MHPFTLPFLTDPEFGYRSRTLAEALGERLSRIGLEFLAPGSSWMGDALLIVLAAVVIIAFVALFGLWAVWMERKVSGHMQCRLGPMHVGPHGALQTLADGVKLLAKEDIVPRAVDRPLYVLSPMLVFGATMVTFIVIPFGPNRAIGADLDLGLFFVAAVGALESIGIILGAWASNNKWSVFGGIRAATQIVSYEIPLGLALLTVIAVAGSMSLQDITLQQQGPAGPLHWLLFRNPFMPLAFLILFIASLAECKRAPFDLPEAESELVTGFHTEYTGIRFAMFFVAEYAAMYAVSAIAAVGFLGGWFSGIPALDQYLQAGGFLAVAIGFCILFAKANVLVFVQMWLRWTLPRIRLDQMIYVCYKVLLPFGLAALLGAGIWEYMFPGKIWFFGGAA